MDDWKTTLHLGFGLFSGAFAVSFQGVYQHLPNVANSTLSWFHRHPKRKRNHFGTLLDLLEGPGDTGDTTPPKTNMEPENGGPLEKEIPIGNHHFQVPC